MKGYTRNLVPRDERVLLHKAGYLISILPDDIARDPEWPDHPVEIRCHELARAIGILFDLPVVDGQYGIADHSWLRMDSEKPYNERKILDVYTVGQLPQVQLLVLNWKLAHTKLYVPGPTRTDIQNDVVDRMVAFLRHHETEHDDQSRFQIPYLKGQ